jgi:hypothetical protein
MNLYFKRLLAQVFRSSCAILVLFRPIGGKGTIAQIIKSLKQGKLAAS